MQVSVGPKGFKRGVVTDKEMWRFRFWPAIFEIIDNGPADVIEDWITYSPLCLVLYNLDCPGRPIKVASLISLTS